MTRAKLGLLAALTALSGCAPPNLIEVRLENAVVTEVADLGGRERATVSVNLVLRAEGRSGAPETRVWLMGVQVDNIMNNNVVRMDSDDDLTAVFPITLFPQQSEVVPLNLSVSHSSNSWCDPRSGLLIAAAVYDEYADDLFGTGLPSPVGLGSSACP